MKKTNLLYWIFTALFSAAMLFSAIPDIMMVPEAITFMNHLGYPSYFILFIGVAKTLGVVAILIPGFPRIREWAYAGLFYDLIGATYSVIAVEGLQPQTSFILVFFGLGLGSYLYNRKVNAESH
ncbi:MAG: DoxX family protein [bacterium]|nr:DoxX family protein [bacterium]